MRILLISDRHPCPPANGLYVPFNEFVSSIKKSGGVELDLLLPTSSSINNDNSLIECDINFDKILYAPIRQRSALQILWDVITLRLPPYAVSLELNSNFPYYDFVLATPDGFFETLESIKAIHPLSRTLLWINEPYYTVALGKVLNSFHRGVLGLPAAALSLLKFLIVYLHERCYLRRLDGVVVQTTNELARYQALIGKNAQCIGFVSTNPLKTELLDIDRGDERVLLIHAPRGVDEIRSFVFRFSTRALETGMDCIVRICTNNVEPYVKEFGHLPNVQLIGYQDNLAKVYESVFAAVVFTRQRYGLVNRIKEAMSAGVAVIAYPEALETLGNIQSGTHAFAAGCDEEFVNEALLVARNMDLAVRIGQEARKFVLRNETEGPDQLVEKFLCMLGEQKVAIQT